MVAQEQLESGVLAKKYFKAGLCSRPEKGLARAPIRTQWLAKKLLVFISFHNIKFLINNEIKFNSIPLYFQKIRESIII